MRRYRNAIRRSKLEDKVEECLKRKGINYKYEPREFKLDKRVANARCTECQCTKVVRRSTYTPDFFLPETNVWIEVKGKLTSGNRTAYTQFLQQYPDINLKFLFQADNRINPKSKTRYSEWATKLGCDWVISKNGEVPKEWYET